MSIKTYRPTTPARRNMSVSGEGIDKHAKPEKKLGDSEKKSGRNSYGRITVRHQGGGNKRKYRMQTSSASWMFPVRSCAWNTTPATAPILRWLNIPTGAPLHSRPCGWKTRYSVLPPLPISSPATPCLEHPQVRFIHNIELYPGKGGQLVAAPVLPPSHTKRTWPSRLPSENTTRCIDYMATIGQVRNIDHANVSIGRRAASATWAGDCSWFYNEPC